MSLACAAKGLSREDLEMILRSFEQYSERRLTPALVFAREVDLRTKKDSRVAALEVELTTAVESERRRLRARLEEAVEAVP